MTDIRGNVTEEGQVEEILALGRMVSYVCQRAKKLNLEMSTYFIEMALISLMEDAEQESSDSSHVSDGPAVGNKLHPSVQ